MRLLWITNMAFGHHLNMLGVKNAKPFAGGSWLVAAYESCKTRSDVELTIVTPYNGTEMKISSYEGSTFILMPGGDMRTYDIKSPKNIELCKQLKEKVSPDLLVIWGTEARFQFVVSNVFRDVKQVVYIQGVISSILSHYYDGVPSKYKMQTFRDLINKISSKSQVNNYKCQKKLEQAILCNADAVIVENDWCEDQCLKINPNLKIYRNNLPIRKAFFEGDWKFGKINCHTIFTNAGGYSIKGHHILFQALGIVKKQFPDVKVYIPGPKYIDQTNDIKRKTGYMKFLQKIIKTFDLYSNIEFVGNLSSEDMVRYLESCHVYVMPSVCENHSASLIEAMLVGVPCVSSFVGGVGSLIDNNKNGLLYNSLEPESLAGNICRIFKNSDLCEELSNKAKCLRTLRSGDFGNEFLKICEDIKDSN